jgi:hypothetical protein
MSARESGRPRRAAVACELALALGSFAWLFAHGAVRALWWAGVRSLLEGAASAARLMAVDPATAWSTLASLAKAALITAPLARLLWRRPRHRLAWLPLVALFWPAIFGNAVPAASTWAMWLVLALASAAGWLAAARPWLGAGAIAPWIVALQPLTGHGPPSDFVWSAARLAARCAENDGARPVDFRPDLAVARYYSTTPVSPERMLLVGERGSFWAERDRAGAVHLGPRFPLHSNYWQGCVRRGTVWVASRGFVCHAEPPVPPDAEGHHGCDSVPGPPSAGLEMDYLDALCPTDRETIYVGQLLRGGFLEFDPRTRDAAFHPVIPGLNLQLALRSDGDLVGITTSTLVVFDPRGDKLLGAQPAGLVAMWLDICPADDQVAVADFAGRVRLFAREGAGGYRFLVGAQVPAARRVAYSPSCAHLVVSSGDDRHAFLLRTRDLAVEREWRLGPGLRDVVFLDESTVAATDACTVTLLDAR